MRSLLLAALLAAPIGAFAQAGTASPDDVKLVEIFLKRPVDELPPAAVDHFLSIDPETLPKKLQKGYAAKRIQLYTLKHLAESKKKGAIRTPEKNCEPPADDKSPDIGALKMAGYVEIAEEDEQCFEKQTQCSELELQCEFTLTVVAAPGPKKKRVRHLLIYGQDPLLNLLVKCHPQNGVGAQTNFFGAMTPYCSH